MFYMTRALNGTSWLLQGSVEHYHSEYYPSCWVWYSVIQGRKEAKNFVILAGCTGVGGEAGHCLRRKQERYRFFLKMKA